MQCVPSDFLLFIKSSSHSTTVSNKEKRCPATGRVVPRGRLRSRIILTFRHYKGGKSSAKRTGRLYQRRNPWYSLSEAESTSGHMVLSRVPRKKSPVTPPGIDPGTVRLVAQCLSHYATPGPKEEWWYWKLREAALHRTLWRTGFGKGCGPVVRQTAGGWNNSVSYKMLSDCFEI